LKVTACAIPDVLLIEPRRFEDSRGWFAESFQAHRYAEHGIPTGFAQDSLSWSGKHVLRGLHMQVPRAQGKLVSCLRGEIFDVAVDLRPGSPTERQCVVNRLTESNGHQLWIPPRFAHGFLVLGDGALFHYKCTEPYDPAGQLSIRWNDPELSIPWPVQAPILSEKDAAAPLLRGVIHRLGR
jgi:dTDP-4-dehydrorhamnose 3,5-epimerase